jgi:ATP:ADP antiporter, AAA family
MNVSRTVLNALNVRREEWWLVRKLFILQFFQGAGIAFFYTTALEKFLHRFHIENLAYLYILSAVMLWVAGFVYSRLEHHFGIAKISILTTAIMAVSMLLFFLAAGWVHTDWFYFGILAWFHVLYLLNNLSFWGLASQLYDVRQSKRLFAVISAGDIPAKFIGYTTALLIVSKIGIDNLLFVGFVCMLISFPYLLSVLRSSREELGHQPHAKEKQETKISLLLKNYTVNTLVRRVAVLSLLISVCIILLTYHFYSAVKENNRSGVELATYIALFQAIGSLLALITKTFFASRIVQWLGHEKALILTPVVLIGFMITLLMVARPAGNDETILYIFGFAYIVMDGLRSSINAPILLALMQPLSTTQRLRAHNIVKGFMDPFGYLLCGLLLLFLFTKEWYSIYSLSYILLFLAVGWIVNIILVNMEYMKTLIKTISSRYFSQEEFDLTDKETQKMVEQKIASGSELEVFYILNMLSTRKTKENEPLVLKALEHPSPKIVMEALRLVSDQKILAAVPQVKSLISSHPDIHVKSSAIKILAESGADNSTIYGFLYQSDKELQQAAIIAIINYGKSSAKYAEAVVLLASLVQSPRIAENKEALVILSQLKVSGFENEILELLNGDNPEIKIETIRAIGLNPTEKTLSPLFDYLPVYEKEVMNSLFKADTLSLPIIRTNLLQNSLTEKQKLNLIGLCGRMEGASVQKVLFNLLREMPHFSPAVIRALHKCQFKAGLEEKKKVEELIRLYLVIAAEILHMHKRIHTKKDVYHLLHNSLQIELDDLKITLLCLFSFLYDSDKINKIRSALAIQKKATIANAMELVDMTVRKDFARPFTVIFESGDIEHRCNSLKDLFPKELFPEVEQILHTILLDDRFSFNQWTMACSLYTSKKYLHALDKRLIRKYTVSEILLLKETAEFAL